MVDIAMCRGHECPKKNECVRYLAKPCPYRQSYFGGSPVDATGKCKHFLSTENWGNRIILRTTEEVQKDNEEYTEE